MHAINMHDTKQQEGEKMVKVDLTETAKADIVRRLRNAKAIGISLSAIARIADVDGQAVRRLERELNPPKMSAAKLLRIKGALDEIKEAL